MVKGLRSFRSLGLKYSGWSSDSSELSNLSSSRMYMPEKEARHFGNFTFRLF